MTFRRSINIVVFCMCSTHEFASTFIALYCKSNPFLDIILNNAPLAVQFWWEIKGEARRYKTGDAAPRT